MLILSARDRRQFIIQEVKVVVKFPKYMSDLTCPHFVLGASLHLGSN